MRSSRRLSCSSWRSSPARSIGARRRWRYAQSAAAARQRERVLAILAVARRYALGDLSRPAPDYGDDDLGSVARGMDQAVQELGRRIDSLSRDRARMEAILASMIEGVLVVNEQGRLQLVNDAARRILKLEHGRDRSLLRRGHPPSRHRRPHRARAGRAKRPRRWNCRSRATPRARSSPGSRRW